MTPAPDAGAESFSRAVNYVIDRLEGGGTLVQDAGGLTRWGISKKANPDVDIANLTRDGAIDIYRRKYWNAVKGDLLPAALALLVFDAAVNMGPGYVARMLQRLLGIAEDGVIGAKTLLAARAFTPQSELRALFNGVRLQAYYDLVARKPFNKPNLWGWTCRVMRVADEAGRWGDA